MEVRNQQHKLEQEPALESCKADVKAKRVPEAGRASFLPSWFGPLFLSGESTVYTFYGYLVKGYSGGSWDFYETPGGAKYMVPAIVSQVQVEVDSNGYEGVMSSDAAGITACLFALNHMCWRHESGALVDAYHALRDFASDHLEARAIFAAID